MVDIGFVIAKYYSGHGFYIDNNDYKTLKWYEDNTTPRPTLEEITEKWNEHLTSEPWKELRQERNRRLADVDWIFSEDYAIDDASYQQWLTYRKALRDLPSVTEDPVNPVWPSRPPLPTGTTDNKELVLRNIRIENMQLRQKLTLCQNKVTHLSQLLASVISRVEALETAT